MDVCMGGRAAEEAVLGADKVTSGASSDFAQATNIAREMVLRWGMSDLGAFLARVWRDASFFFIYFFMAIFFYFYFYHLTYFSVSTIWIYPRRVSH
jgi:hypothetical protein